MQIRNRSLSQSAAAEFFSEFNRIPFTTYGNLLEITLENVLVIEALACYRCDTMRQAYVIAVYVDDAVYYTHVSYPSHWDAGDDNCVELILDAAMNALPLE